MAKLVVNIKALPRETTDDANKISDELKDFLSSYGIVYKREVQPLAFGLSVILVTLVIDESLGTNSLEEAFKSFKAAELTIVDVSRIVDF